MEQKNPIKNDDGSFYQNIIWVVAAACLGLGVLVKMLQAPTPDTAQSAVLRTAVQGGARTEIITEDACRRADERLWVRTAGTALGTAGSTVECIAYVIAKPAQQMDQVSNTAVVFFNGDIPTDDLTETGAAALRKSNLERASAIAQKYNVTTFVVGRPGTMGSTGFHQAGGLAEDAEIANHALDLLKAKFSFRRFALAGQSGGSRLIAQMLIIGRGDVICATMGSGAYGTPRLINGGKVGTNIFGKTGQHYLVPLDTIEQLSADRNRRHFVIGDPQDTIAPFEEQRAWHGALVARNHNAVLIEARGAGPDRHGTSSQAMAATAACAQGQTDTEIITLARAP